MTLIDRPPLVNCRASIDRRTTAQATPFVIRKDARGAQMHVRRRDTGECVGCIEAGLFAIVRAVIEQDLAASIGEGSPVKAAREGIVAR